MDQIAKEIRKKRRALNNKHIIIDFITRLAMFIMMMYLIFVVLFGLTTMKNDHMKPKIDAGDVLLYYRLDTINISDVVVFDLDGKEYVGRVVAKQNDIVDIRKDKRLYINDHVVIENEIYYETPIYESDVEYPVELKEDSYFILCDFRQGGKDSRYFGPVTKDAIKGKVITVLKRRNI